MIETRPRIAFVRLAPWIEVARPHPRDLMWPVSMLYSASLADLAGWQSTIIDQHVQPAGYEEIAASLGVEESDVLIIDINTPSVPFALRLADRVRDHCPHTRIWAAGQHPSCRPGDFLVEGSPFKGCLLGEYEASIQELLSKGGEGSTGPTILHGADGSEERDPEPALVMEPDTLPPLEPDGLALDSYRVHSLLVPSRGRTRWGFLLTSRGCPHRCIFCSATLRASYGHEYRAQSAARVAEDMQRLVRDHRIGAFYLIDDYFTLDRQRVIDLCRILIDRRFGVHWAIQTRAESVDLEMLRLLKRAGCTAVKVGVESGVDRILELLDKGCSRDIFVSAARDIREAGLYLTACFMIGNPTETLEDIEKTFRFALRLQADMIQVALHTPYPGSRSYEMYSDRIRDPSELSHYDGKPAPITDIDMKVLEACQRKFYLRYYLNPRILVRYMFRRAPYRILDPGEWKLVWNSMRYFLSGLGGR